VHKPEDFVWINGARDAINLLNDRGYNVVVVSNQSGIARGYFSTDDVNRLHDWINEDLKTIGAHIDKFYFCPYHPEFPDERYVNFRNWRKPEPGMLLQAMRESPVRRTESFMIGDSENDLEAARRAGIEGFLYEAGNLREFVEAIIER
jgi:D-glycero-D-manno-heptose 1,7-bisphosphate phosphatase